VTATLLVATDGSPSARGSLRLARQLEALRGYRIEILGVVEPLPVFDAGFLVAVPEAELYESRREALRREIEAQVREVRPDAEEWRIHVEAGTPASRIVAVAEGLRAEAILLGLGRHSPVDRILGSETALQVARLSHLPVLAVPAEAEALPRRAAVGIDFSEFSRRAARTAARLMKDPWELHLVHVMSGMEFLPAVSEDWRADFEGEVSRRLERLAAELPQGEGSEIRVAVLEGEPAQELLAYAKRHEVDLLVAGSHGHSFVGRLLMGSVSTRLLRKAHTPVLVVPPAEIPEEVTAPGRIGPPHPWVELLAGFSKRNAGRPTTLELDDPELGAQECGRNIPLWGVDYDPRRDRLDIMLGHAGTVEGHLTHSFPAPREVEVVQDPEGRDRALRIRLERGQAILKIHEQ